MHAASRILAGALLLAAPAAFAQSTATLGSVPATANIIKGLTLANVTGMSFGNIVTGTTSGTVVMTSAGIRTPSGGATLASGGTPSAAAFAVVGHKSRTYAITVPGAPVTLTETTLGVATMTVGTFTSSLGAIGTLDNSGAQSFTVGATLNVGASQLEGTYNGTFAVTVAYN